MTYHPGWWNRRIVLPSYAACLVRMDSMQRMCGELPLLHRWIRILCGWLVQLHTRQPIISCWDILAIPKYDLMGKVTKELPLGQKEIAIKGGKYSFNLDLNNVFSTIEYYWTFRLEFRRVSYFVFKYVNMYQNANEVTIKNIFRLFFKEKVISLMSLNE
jgi:hypothetical protein